jgi:hypothetical protein
MNGLLRDFNESARKPATPPLSRPAASYDSWIPISSRDISQAIIRTPSSLARANHLLERTDVLPLQHGPKHFRADDEVVHLRDREALTLPKLRGRSVGAPGII